MIVMQYFGALLMFYAHLAVPKPQCKMCPPGQHLKSCTECADCPSGTYTSNNNTDFSCHSCFKDCRPELHMQEVKRCTTKSNTRCRCQAGFNCSKTDSDTNSCIRCVKQPELMTQAYIRISVRKNQTGIPFRTVSSMTTPCHPPKCGGHLILEDNSSHETSEKSKYAAAILVTVLLIGIIAFVLLLCIHQKTQETCFKQAVKFCNDGVSDATPHVKASSKQSKACGPSGAKHPQQTATAVANLGPVHVHSAGGTVIFSLLSHFTGQGESAGEGKKRPQKDSEEEKEEGCPVFRPTPSPNVPLSQEEGNSEVNQVFFPSQEQGKDCHISKEEVL